MALADDIADNTLGVVLAGGKGTRLAPLTRHTCKPALPFAGLRSIDFSLSNCVNSGVRTVGVPTQYKPRELLAHLARNWGRAATGEAARIDAWRADERAPRLGYRGTADAVYRNLDLVGELGQSLVLVLAGDHVYSMDYRPLLEAHCAKGAAVTVGCVEVPARHAHHFGVLDIDDDSRIGRFVEKPRSRAELPCATSDVVLASMGIYVFDADFLARVLTLDAFTPESTHDFGADILPKLIAQTRAFAYPFRGDAGAPAYWRDIGTLEAYWRGHMELLDRSPPLRLDDPRWPIGGPRSAACAVTGRAATRNGGEIENALVTTPGAVAGHVRRAVIFQDVEVGRGADVADSVVLSGAVIGPGTRLRGVIVDAGHHVPEGTMIDHDAAAHGPLVLASSDDHGAQQQPYAIAH